MNVEAALRLQIERLETENETMRQELGVLRRDNNYIAISTRFGITAQQARVVDIIWTRDRVSREAILSLLPIRWSKSGDRDPKVLDVFICKARKKLEPFGIKIASIWGWGYEMSENSKELMRREIEASRSVGDCALAQRERGR